MKNETKCPRCGKKDIEAADPSRKDVCRCAPAAKASRGVSNEVVRAGAPVGNQNASGPHMALHRTARKSENTAVKFAASPVFGAPVL